jgi:hypothetical protein
MRLHYRSKANPAEVVACEEGTRLHHRLAANTRLWERVDGKRDTILDEAPPPPPPARSARKADWVAHAVTCGADPGTAARVTKQTLVTLYG